jgi:transmembrane protein 17
MEIHSNLPLQIALYFNAFYSAIWSLFTLALFIGKIHLFGSMNNKKLVIIFIIIFICVVVIEPIRIYSGWTGNLSERVPKTFAFLLLTLLQFGLQIYLSGFQSLNSPLNIIFGVIHLVFLSIETVFGIYAIRNFIRLSGIRFSMYFNSDGTVYQPPEEPELKNLEEFDDIMSTSTSASEIRNHTLSMD